MLENKLGLTYERVISPGNSLCSKERALLTKFNVSNEGGGEGGGDFQGRLGIHVCCCFIGKIKKNFALVVGNLEKF